MPTDRTISIDDTPSPLARRRLWIIVFAAALVVGAASALVVATRDLTLSHYDARAHLVVSRRIIDSLTPGWRQIGAVWLPLPHLLSLPFMGWDWAYRVGAPTVAISVVAMALGLASLASFVYRRTGSIVAATTAPALIGLNPNVLYLTGTPMTEPLLIGLALMAVGAVDHWLDTGSRTARGVAVLTIVSIALTRYEGWLIAGALVALAAWPLGSRTINRAAALATPLAVVIGVFLFFGWTTTGVWFTSSGFFERDPRTDGNLVAVLTLVGESTLALGGSAVAAAGLAGLLLSVVVLFRGPSARALPLALLAATLLPVVAFYQGHPHRVRYMVVTVVALSALAGMAMAFLQRRARAPAAVALISLALWQRPPFDARAPMTTEAQWETPFRLGREAVTAELLRSHDGTPILASMGSLGHYMQETSRAGFRLATYLHEGNGDLWTAAVEAPARHVRWVLVEERAEGGDVLATRARADETYLGAFTRVAEGGGVVLYRRRP